jgi:hypothetical protein
MAEKQIAQDFSEKVDRLLAGQSVAGDDALLTLAADLTPGAALDPAPAFVRRLRGQLLRPAPPPRRVLRLRRWSLAGVALSLFIALAVTLLWKPRTLSAAEVLARAADAVAVNPGQIEYIVTKSDVVMCSDDGFEVDICPDDKPEIETVITKVWNHIALTQDDLLTVSEWTVIAYAVSDTERNHPLYQGYSSSTLTCVESFHQSFPDVPELRDCITMDQVGPGPAARNAAESLQDWIARMQASEAEIEFHETEFDGRPVYSLTYLEDNRSVVVSSNSLGGTGRVTQAYTSTNTVTVYIDRETYLPTGKTTEYETSDDDTSSHTYTVLQYQVLNPDELDFDPFVWPPER